MSETAWLRVSDGLNFLNTNTLEELIEQRNAMFHRREALRAQVALLDAAVEALDREMVAFVDACAVVRRRQVHGL